MNLTEFAIEKRAISIFAAFLLGVGGVAAFFSLGQLEDPDFTVKTALVVTQYPGASPREVELEVTDRIEKAIQEMPQVKDLYSTSTAGVSTVVVDILNEYWADRLPQVWDELRNKVADVAPTLPPGASEPEVVDDFSFVYGFVLAVTGDGFSKAELDNYIDRLRKDLALVPGIAHAVICNGNFQSCLYGFGPGVDEKGVIQISRRHVREPVGQFEYTGMPHLKRGSVV